MSSSFCTSINSSCEHSNWGSDFCWLQSVAEWILLSTCSPCEGFVVPFFLSLFEFQFWSYRSLCSLVSKIYPTEFLLAVVTVSVVSNGNVSGLNLVGVLFEFQPKPSWMSWWIWGSHSSDCEQYGLIVCNALYFGKRDRCFGKKYRLRCQGRKVNKKPAEAGGKQYIAPKYRALSEMHWLTAQKAVIFLSWWKFSYLSSVTPDECRDRFFKWATTDSF
jgi:hypothetical protein